MTDASLPALVEQLRAYLQHKLSCRVNDWCRATEPIKDIEGVVIGFQCPSRESLKCDCGLDTLIGSLPHQEPELQPLDARAHAGDGDSAAHETCASLPARARETVIAEDDELHTGDDELLDTLTSIRAGVEQLIEELTLTDQQREDLDGIMEDLATADALRVAELKALTSSSAGWQPKEEKK